MRSFAVNLALVCLTLFGAIASTWAAAPNGVWWDTQYSYRQQINVPAGTTALQTQYAVSFVLDHAIQVSAARSLASGNDVRVVRWTGTGWTELDRILDPDTSWNTNTARIWFRTAVAIPQNTTDDNYYVYYGNNIAAAPPANSQNIFSLYDDFTSNPATSGRWNADETTHTAGQVHVEGDGTLMSTSAFGVDTIWETRARLSRGNANFDYWGARYAYLFINYQLTFQSDPNSHQAIADGFLWTDEVAFNPGTPTNFQQYSFTREGTDVARFLVNGAQVVRFDTDSLPGNDMNVWVENNQNNQTIELDWARVRPYRNPEPVPTRGPQEMYLVPVPAAVGEWRMEEAGWSGTGAVLDSSGNNLQMTRAGSATTSSIDPAAAIAGDPGTCRYGAFNGTTDYIQVADNALLDLTSQLTVTAWIRPRSLPTGSGLKSIASKDSNYEFHLNSGGQIYWWWNGGAQTLTTTGTAIPINQWTHVAITYRSGAQRIYINGVQRASAAFTGTLQTNNLPFQIGEDQGIADRRFNGYIDEVRVYSSDLSQPQVAAVMNQTHPCTGVPSGFVITHDRWGVNCAPESVTVSVRDANNNPLTDYAQQITLTTQTGRGTWSINGSDLNNDTGTATYTWPSGQSSRTFSLAYPRGNRTFDIDVYQTSNSAIRDDDTENTMTFSQTGFTVTAAALSNPPPTLLPNFPHQTAGDNVSVHIAAYGQTATDPECGVIEAYDGDKPIKFWMEYVTPASGNTRQISINGTNVAISEAAANARNVRFTQGQASVTMKYKDVGRVALSMKDDSEAHPNVATGTRGSTGNFVVKPSYFHVTNVRRNADGVSNPVASNETDPVFVAAGAPFSFEVEARDTEHSVTPNFGREGEALALDPTLVAPVGGTAGALGGTFSISQGIASTTNFTWSEVGIIRLMPRIADSDYLGAGNVIGTTSGNVGRFVPHRFLASTNSPMFTTQCVAGSFSYVGQPLRYVTPPLLTITAVNAGGAVTTNYRGPYFKLTHAEIASEYVINAGAFVSMPAATTHSSLVAGNGVGTLTFDHGPMATPYLKLSRNSPLAPFDAQIKIRSTLRDSDGVFWAGSGASDANPYEIGAGSGIPFSAGSTQRYGRLALRNVVGSELLNLPVPMRTEYYHSDSVGYVASSGDSCTPAPAISFTNFTGALTNMTHAPLTSASNGNYNLTLIAPGAGRGGSVRVRADAPSYLEYDWDGSNSGLEDPSAMATFGIFQGNSKRIYQRERIIK